MNARSWKGGRLALLALGVVVAGMLFALPATAYAKYTTRIVAASSVTVVRDTPGVNPWPKALSVKLQKKVSGTYRSLSGTVKLYRYDPVDRKYVYVSSRTGLERLLQPPGSREVQALLRWVNRQLRRNQVHGRLREHRNHRWDPGHHVRADCGHHAVVGRL